ncbi:MAG TPA: TonB-dependent receptor, partial [Mucilaginibacter sp.]|nr:TonB-dependent receptor [Mucilaginibacter sp.]
GGYYEWLDANGNLNGLAGKNPVGLLNQTTGHGYTKRGLGSVSFDYTFPFLKELELNATFGGDESEGRGNNTTLNSAASATTANTVGSYSQYYGKNYTYNADYYLKYSKDFKSIKSHLDAQVGYSYQYFHFDNRPVTTYAGNQTTVIGTPANSFPGHYFIESPFARLNFNVMDKYLLTATIRDDRSSRFSDLNRNGYFPAIGLAWRIKEEDFLKSVDFLSDLKLRVGYGITGQQDLGNNFFPYLAVYDPSNSAAQYQFGNNYVNTLRADAYNLGIKWEQTATTNVGFDYGFLNGRISGSIEYYYKKTKDLLFDTPLADGTNLTNHVAANIGNLHTQGIDFNISATPIDTKDFKWNFGYNISFNKITTDNLSATHDPNQIIPTGGIPGGVGNTIQLLKAGYTPYTFYVFQQVYGSNGMPLDGVYVDRNGNGSSLDDKYLYKHPNPTVFMGFNSNFNYKQWGLSFAMRANLGNYVYNAVQASNGAYAGLKFQGYLNNIPNSILKTNFQQYQLYSDYYVENASFLKMDNAALSYNFGKVARTATLRASFNVQNVFVVTKYTGLDPEISSGIDANIYPRPRVFSLGLNLNY